MQSSRFRLRRLNKKFEKPLSKILFVATKSVTRISTNGSGIYFDPDWLQKLGDKELDFILAHELMHILLGHIDRPKYYRGDRFHLACDIVADSYLELLGMEYERLPNIGRIFCRTFYPSQQGRFLSAQEAFRGIPFDPAAMKNGVRRNYMIDSDAMWERKSERGECGTVVLLPSDPDPDDLLFRRKPPAEEVELHLRKEVFSADDSHPEGLKSPPKAVGKPSEVSKSGNDRWEKYVSERLKKLKHFVENEQCLFDETWLCERIWQMTNNAKIDWRKLLAAFVGEDGRDYSFTPPDRRFSETEFFLPDYNLCREQPKNILFMVDTSGSVDDRALSAVYGELCNALTQFGRGMNGLLGFFDTKVEAPVPFSDIGELLNVVPYGGGNTNFYCIFDYIKHSMQSVPLSEIVIFTDGKAEFPPESAANGLPVLWLLSEKDVVPPWGKFAYTEID